MSHLYYWCGVLMISTIAAVVLALVTLFGVLTLFFWSTENWLGLAGVYGLVWCFAVLWIAKRMGMRKV